MVLRDDKNRDRLFSVVLIFISTILYIVNSSYPEASALFPGIIMVVLAVLSLILFGKTFWIADKKKQRGKLEESIINKDIVVIAVLTAIYIFILIPFIGYYPSSFLYIICCYFYNKVSKILMIFVPIFFCIAVYAFFQYSLGLVLP